MILQRKSLLRALKMTAMVVERRVTIPVLATVLVNPTTEGVEIIATDLDMEVRATLRDARAADRAFLLGRPEALVSLVKAAEGEEIAFSVKPTRKEYRKVRRRGEDVIEEVTVGGETLIRAEGLAADLGRGASPDDFPHLVRSEPIWSAEVGSDFMRALAAVSLAMSTEETRYYLNGVFFHHVSGWTYRLAATDGHRLIYADVQMPNSPTPDDNGMGKDKDGGVIIPRKAVAALLKIHAANRAAPIGFSIRTAVAGNEKPDLKANPSMTRVEFKVGDVSLTSKLIDGTFPHYQRVIPAEGIHVAEVSRADLRRVVGALVGFQTERTRAVKMVFGEGLLTLSANVLDQGVASMPIEAKIEGDGFEVGFNGRYLLAMCAAIAGDTIRISTADQASPCLVYDPASDEVRTVLMPMRV